MKILESREFSALCDYRGEQRTVDTTLVGPQTAGAWLMVFLGTAREVLTEEHAIEISNALDAVETVMSGNTEIDHLFTDLIDREPQLPEHLQRK